MTDDQIRVALQNAYDEGWENADEWHDAHERGYVPGYINALIAVARKLGFAYYKDGDTCKVRKR